MSTVANDVIIVTSSLTRDMIEKEDSHRGPAMRALCKIIDVNEVQEAVNNDNIMVQYHALDLLYQIRRTDKYAIRKLIVKFSKAGFRSP
ncbi:unnamed protein product, partial [Rotaria sp. Silwood1]